MAQPTTLSPTSLPATFMPFFDFHRSASTSSINTRQRSDFEGTTSTSNKNELQDEENEDSISSSAVDSYPASELPFSSEPALETELENQLPPLKKIRPTKQVFSTESLQDQSSSDTSLFYHPDNDDRIVVINVLKSILTKKEATTRTCTSPIKMESTTSWRTIIEEQNNRPITRRSSTNGTSSTHSLKAVRFASGNGFIIDSDDKPIELEGPVAAIMYLTHSAHAYDRSPIIVEKSLRLPPRQDADECGRWVMCSSIKRYKSVEEVGNSGSGLSLSRTATNTNSDTQGQEEKKKVFQSRVLPEEEDDDEDDKQTEIDDDEEEEEEEEEEIDHQAEDEEDERSELCGLGRWSRCDVFSYDDALGGF
ncbi:hypothetical protein CROQUDRAFT_98828 [Cronartium quercuum f. sp. fusiforme G11]|uniref:Uncharacterized protein n=1 Tax=Cronartium quercuum f. sp. fusiforme G11 TaxID=708437 RepID=A0A9P6N8Q4_9BASI|nr:hypothetical protein CROQUDRAFT_98828 [Cronartium quercuum f. sp. fusiforme G11]